MYQRHLAEDIQAALEDTPVILVHGARQVGKTTLVQRVAEQVHGSTTYVTFDQAAMLAAARSDPDGFIAGFEGPGCVVLDEVQRVPDLFRAIKATVDTDRRPGRFLLTGSANMLLLPQLSESLAGRMEVIELWPLSQGELEGRRETFVDRVMSGDITAAIAGSDTSSRTALIERALGGGYPEVISRRNEKRRSAWFGGYLTTILQRDVRDIANIQGLTDLPRLLSLLATRVGSPVNMSDIATSISIPNTTLRRYMTLLEATFLVRLLPAWSTNRERRLAKSPRLMLMDTGLMGHLLALSTPRVEQDASTMDALLTNFAFAEVSKQLAWARTTCELLHFRSFNGRDVDLVLEDPTGRVAGIDIQTRVSVNEEDFRGLKALADIAGENFASGVILYPGQDVVPFGKRMFAVPFASLWN